ncbi:MAG: hypothetical protein Q4E11_02415 [Corynebacterium sp.]|uniref:hypothetical protein n=1 Tax=Corynebacterium sp. TaxID=1720 RepID=UPI0026DA73BA|nr:hypothetical protein [Corynebacterium sp.]MDO5029421.1 hypothetical protein [Corynebacterium sp.]
MTKAQVTQKQPKSSSSVWGQAVIYAAIFGFLSGVIAWAGLTTKWAFPGVLLLIAVQFVFDYRNREGVFDSNWADNAFKWDKKAKQSWGAVLALVAVLLIAPNVPRHNVGATAAVTIVAVALMLFVSVKKYWPGK